MGNSTWEMLCGDAMSGFVYIPGGKTVRLISSEP